VIDPITGYVYDVFDALQYAVEEYKVPATGKVLPVISMSYGDCEQSLAGDSGYVAWVTTIGQEANSQGQTIVVSSGDSGAFAGRFKCHDLGHGERLGRDPGGTSHVYRRLSSRELCAVDERNG
jgi:hypothetical protein